MSSSFIIIVVVLLGAFVVFFVVRRMIRLAIRVAFIFALLFALLAGGLWMWWRSSAWNTPATNARPTQQTRPARPRS